MPSLTVGLLSKKSMKRILAQVKKELTQLWRDWLTLALALVLPLLLLLLLSKATSLSVKDIPVAVQDLDKTPMSRQYLEAIGASLSFKLTALPTNVSPEHLLSQYQARAALIIPPNFERDPGQGRRHNAKFYGPDSARGNAAGGATSDSLLVQSRPRRFEVFWPGRAGIWARDVSAAAGRAGPFARGRIENDSASLRFEHHGL